MLADAGYMPMRQVITPYARLAGQKLPPDQERWSYNLSKCRMTIEHTFGILKGRFSSLKYLPIQIDTDRDQNRAHLWIHCCVILHNFLIDEADNDRFWDDKGGVEGMIATLDRLRKSNAKDRLKYERMTGVCLDSIASTEDLDDIARDETMRELIKASAEARSYRPYYEDN